VSRTITAGQYLVPIAAAGTPATAAGPRGVYTLANSTTYYVAVGAFSSTYQSLHLQWSSPVVATITFESSDFAEAEAALTSTTSGDWLQENPSTAYVPITGTGASVLAMTITLAGGGIGGARVNITGLAAGRMRVKIVVTTGGTIRVAEFGKD
jgi:hypothetical protein